MNKDEFKSMFDKFNAQSEAVYFDEAAWDASVKKWKTYFFLCFIREKETFFIVKKILKKQSFYFNKKNYNNM